MRSLAAAAVTALWRALDVLRRGPSRPVQIPCSGADPVGAVPPLLAGQDPTQPHRVVQRRRAVLAADAHVDMEALFHRFLPVPASLRRASALIISPPCRP